MIDGVTLPTTCVRLHSPHNAYIGRTTTAVTGLAAAFVDTNSSDCAGGAALSVATGITPRLAQPIGSSGHYVKQNENVTYLLSVTLNSSYNLPLCQHGNVKYIDFTREKRQFLYSVHDNDDSVLQLPQLKQTRVMLTHDGPCFRYLIYLICTNKSDSVRHRQTSSRCR